MNSGEYKDSKKGYKFFMPTNLQNIEKELRLDNLQQLLEKADMAIGQLTALEQLLPNPELITERYAITEALLSSQIEGTQSTLIEIFENKDKSDNVGEDVREVNNYFRALNYGVRQIQFVKFPLSLRLLKDCHSILMDGVRGGEPHKTSGAFRESQNWIGGSSPSNAYFVPPPQEEVLPLMGELERYMYEGRLPNLVKIALIHYQFETIHPFIDGNGRIGRLLIPLFLISKDIMHYPTLYLSLYLKKNKIEYYDLLMDVRNNSRYERWIKFFLEGIVSVSTQIMKTTKSILDLNKSDSQLVKTKNEIALLEKLFINPTTNIKQIENELSISNQTANTLIHKFESLGILQQTNNTMRYKKYVYKRYIDIIEMEL